MENNITKEMFRNQITNLNSLASRYYEIAKDLRSSLKGAQLEFFNEHLGYSIDTLREITTKSSIMALGFKDGDIDKYRVQIASSILNIITDIEKKNVSEFLATKGSSSKFFKEDFTSMLISVGYRYHDNPFLEKNSLKLHLISQVCEVKTTNIGIDQASYIELVSPGAIDQYNNAHIKAVYQTVNSREME